MKKTPKKLKLAKETVRNLEWLDFGNKVHGGAASDIPSDCFSFCCPSKVYNCLNFTQKADC